MSIKEKTKLITDRQKLKPKPQAFVDNYTNIDNPITFGNGTQSVQAIYKYDSRHTAANAANRLLNNTNVKDAIEQQIIAAGLESKVRLQAVAEVIHGSHVTKSTTTAKKGRKILYKTTTEKTPSAKEVLSAVDLIEKISGTYDKNKAKADVMSAELKTLLRKHRKELDG